MLERSLLILIFHCFLSIETIEENVTLTEYPNGDLLKYGSKAHDSKVWFEYGSRKSNYMILHSWL